MNGHDDRVSAAEYGDRHAPVYDRIYGDRCGDQWLSNERPQAAPTKMFSHQAMVNLAGAVAGTM